MAAEEVAFQEKKKRLYSLSVNHTDDTFSKPKATSSDVLKIFRSMETLPEERPGMHDIVKAHFGG